jgi:hypothetical protein
MMGCSAVLYMYDGEYEGECERPDGHKPPHWDGLSTWRTDEDGGTDYEAIDLDEDRQAVERLTESRQSTPPTSSTDT